MKLLKKLNYDAYKRKSKNCNLILQRKFNTARYGPVKLPLYYISHYQFLVGNQLMNSNNIDYIHDY